MSNFMPQQVRGPQLRVMDLSKAGTNILAPYSNAIHDENIMAQKKANADALATYRTQQQSFQNEQATKTANFKEQQATYQNEQAMATKTNRDKLLGIQRDRYNLAKKQYDRTVNLYNANTLVSSFDATVPITTQQDKYTESNYNQGVAGLKEQAELDKQRIIDTPTKDDLLEINSKTNLSKRKQMLELYKQYKNIVGSSVHLPTSEAISAQKWIKADDEKRINAAKAHRAAFAVNNTKQQVKLAKVDLELNNNLDILKSALLKPTTKLTVPEYRNSIKSKLDAQLQNKYKGKDKTPSNFEITALNKRVNELTNNYQAALQVPLAKEAKFNMFKRKEGVKAEYKQVLAKIKNRSKNKGIGNISDALSAQAYLNRVNRSMFTDDDNIEYDNALGKVNAYITQYNIKHPEAPKSPVTDKRW